jgi:hypothetical protein
MPGGPTARQGDEPPAASASALTPEIVSAGSPPMLRSGDAMSTVDELHWFG